MLQEMQPVSPITAECFRLLQHLFSGDAGEAKDVDAPLEDAGRNEWEYVRRRLREELGREPDEQEIDEWLRQHTEGY